METYVELAKGGKSEFVKKIGNAMIQMRNLELSRIGIKKCVVLRILKIKRNFVMRVLYRQKSQNPLPLRTVNLKQDPNIQEIFISMIPIYPKKIFQVEKKLLN